MHWSRPNLRDTRICHQGSKRSTPRKESQSKPSLDGLHRNALFPKDHAQKLCSCSHHEQKNQSKKKIGLNPIQTHQHCLPPCEIRKPGLSIQWPRQSFHIVLDEDANLGSSCNFDSKLSSNWGPISEVGLYMTLLRLNCLNIERCFAQWSITTQLQVCE